MALLPKGCANGGTLLLNDGPLIGDRFGGTDVANELFDCGPVPVSMGENIGRGGGETHGKSLRSWHPKRGEAKLIRNLFMVPGKEG